MSVGIYKFQNLINGKCYIGLSQSLEVRYRNHKQCSKYKDSSFYRAIRNYGWENFSYEIIENCTIEELNEKEKFWIKYYNSFKNGYNETQGGEGIKGCGIKINSQVALQIIQDLKSTSKSFLEIAEEYDLHFTEIYAINRGDLWRRENFIYPIRKKENKKYYCKNCNKQISNSRVSFCKECIDKLQRIVERPTREELKKLIRSNSFVKIGKQYGVSDNAIRKWCKKENLPFKVSDIQSYSDEQWNEI